MGAELPNRILRDDILESEDVNKLIPVEEVFYRRLMSKVDDWALYHAHPQLLKSALYPLKSDKVREADISLWLAACQKAGLIVLYEIERKPYLWFLKFKQKIRAKYSKFPLPEGYLTSTCSTHDSHVLPRASSPSPSSTKAFSFGESERDFSLPASSEHPLDDGGPFLRLWEFWVAEISTRPGRLDLAFEEFSTLPAPVAAVEKIIAWARSMKAGKDWQKEGGKFIPGLPRVIRERVWLNFKPKPERRPQDAKPGKPNFAT